MNTMATYQRRVLEVDVWRFVWSYSGILCELIFETGLEFNFNPSTSCPCHLYDSSGRWEGTKGKNTVFKAGPATRVVGTLSHVVVWRWLHSPWALLWLSHWSHTRKFQLRVRWHGWWLFLESCTWFCNPHPAQPILWRPHSPLPQPPGGPFSHSPFRVVFRLDISHLPHIKFIFFITVCESEFWSQSTLLSLCYFIFSQYLQASDFSSTLDKKNTSQMTCQKTQVILKMNKFPRSNRQ